MTVGKSRPVWQGKSRYWHDSKKILVFHSLRGVPTVHIEALRFLLLVGVLLKKDRTGEAARQAFGPGQRENKWKALQFKAMDTFF